MHQTNTTLRMLSNNSMQPLMQPPTLFRAWLQDPIQHPVPIKNTLRN